MRNRINKCIDCSKIIHRQSTRCRSCANKYKSKFKKGKPKCMYCGKEVGYKYNICQGCFLKHRSRRKYYCIDCGVRVSKKGVKKCRKCADKKRRIGIKHSVAVKQQMSLSHGGTGIPYENRDYSLEFYSTREQIRKRDNYTCQLCGQFHNKIKRQLDIHHIDYNKNNNREENLISLCNSCHAKTNYNRTYWLEFFASKENNHANIAC